jgi:hypothetical protein
MPYYLEKGPMFSVIEDYLNADTSRAVETLRELRKSPGDQGYLELWEMAAFASKNLTAKPPPPYADDFRDKWLGMGPNGPADSMWDNYEGDVNGITRLTIRRALEVALGVAHTASDVPDPPPQHWPIDLFWKCGQNWFEGWVTHRSLGSGPPGYGPPGSGPPGSGVSGPPRGHVVVVFATPTEGSTVVDRPADHQLINPSADFEVDPTGVVGDERAASLMVITHRHNEAQPSWSIDVIPIDSTFEVRLNPARYVGKDGLVTVAPSERDGGVLATPRPFVP